MLIEFDWPVAFCRHDYFCYCMGVGFILIFVIHSIVFRSLEMANSQTQLQKLWHELQEIETGQPNHSRLKGYLEDVNNLCDILFTESDAYEKGEIEKCRQHIIYALYVCITLTRKLISKVWEALDEREKLSRMLDDLKRERRDLDKTCSKLDEYEQKLYAGQLACMVQEALVSKVLEVSFGGSESPKRIAGQLRISTITQLQMAIDGEENYRDVFSDELREIVERNWSKLKNALKWEGKHFRCLKILKQVRVPIAHPQVNQETMKTAVCKLPLKPFIKETCIELIEIPSKLKMLKL